MAVNFDARNQGMQNIPAALVDESIEVGVAPREEWPLFYAWHIKWLESWKSDDVRNFDEYREDYLSKGLSTEQEWQIINAWKNHMDTNPRDERTFDEFRETFCAISYQGEISGSETAPVLSHSRKR